jgi:hypothetical protein
MQIERISSLLQAIADVRNWIVANVPLTTSMVGYDLFLKLGNDLFIGRDLDIKAVCSELPYSEETVRLQIEKMVEAGLVAVVDNGNEFDGRSRHLRATAKFADLLDNYYKKFGSQFILRKELRAHQLFVHAAKTDLIGFTETLYDHFYDLGWFYLHNFGAICFLMASLVKRAAVEHGHRARIESCYVELLGPDVRYLLGGKGHAKPGQIEGHAMCVIDDAIVIDFGLGNMRRGYRRDFYWGMACDYQPDGHVLARMILPTGETVAWKNDWQSPDSEAELKKYEPVVEQLFAAYAGQFGTSLVAAD